jgi:outer membrane lipoprotein SlyB
MRKIVIAVALVVAVAISGCSLSGNTHQSAQAAATDNSNGGVSQMPSGFRNVAYKCVKVGGAWYAVFSVSDGGNGDNKPGSVSAVPDPSCKAWGP